MKNIRKVAFLMLATYLVSFSTFSRKTTLSVHATEFEDNKILISQELLLDIDNYVLVSNNKFILTPNESIDKLIALYCEKNNLDKKKVEEVLMKHINFINEYIEKNSYMITKEKSIVPKYSLRAWDSQLGHDVEVKWWGYRHSLNNRNQVLDYVHKLQSSSSMHTGAALICGFINPVIAALAGVNAWYCNQAATDINYFWEKHQRAFYFDVAFTLNYNFEFQD